MKCLNPFVLDLRGEDMSIIVPCGQCSECRKIRANMWAIRMMHEIKYHDSNIFVTLTYNDESMADGAQLVQKDLTDYIKRVRKAIEPRKIKYYACGEYGEKYGRPHYHLIFFGVGFDDADVVRSKWTYGFVKIGTVTEKSCRYVAKYINKAALGNSKKIMLVAGKVPQFNLMSKGLGERWLIENAQDVAHRGIVRQGKSIGMPRYYKKVLKKIGIEATILDELQFDKQCKEFDRLSKYRGESPDETHRRYLRNVETKIEEVRTKSELYARKDKDNQ